MRSSAIVLAALVGCSSAPLSPRAEATPRALVPAPSASIVAAAPAASAEADAAPAEESEDENDVGDVLAGGAKLALDDGAELVVTVKDPRDHDSPPDVILALVRGRKVIARREGFDEVTGVDARVLTATQPCETWSASLRRESFGSVEGVRVSLGCRMGEDYFTATELAVLFEIDGPVRDLDGLTRIWSGLGGREENAMDSCLTSREVAFRVIDAKTLEKTITVQTRWVDQVIGGDVKRNLKKDCKVSKSKRVERVARP